MITTTDIRRQLSLYLGERIGEYDIDAIVTDIVKTCGLVDIDDIEAALFAGILFAHERTA